MTEQPQCTCKETSCKKGCNSNHTHKGFFCEVCEPEAVKQMQTEEPKIEQPQKGLESWEERFEKQFYLVGTDERDFDGQVVRYELKAFIAKEKEESKRYENEKGQLESLEWVQLILSYKHVDKVKEMIACEIVDIKKSLGTELNDNK